MEGQRELVCGGASEVLASSRVAREPLRGVRSAAAVAVFAIATSRMTTLQAGDALREDAALGHPAAAPDMGS